jgi:N-acetyl-beta-hexosaminidase
MRSVRRKIVCGKFGLEADIRFFQFGIEKSLEDEKRIKGEIRQYWKDIYQHRKKIDRQLKPELVKIVEYRKLYEKKIEDLRLKEALRKQKLGIK